MTIQEAVNNFKKLIETAIYEGGSDAKTAIIRSSKPILNIHEAVKTQLINNKVSKELIFPPINSRQPELKLAGSLKQKNQDICVIPGRLEPKEEVLKVGLLSGTIDRYGEEFTKETLVINVRSQISSIQKNFDTLYERTVSEAQNLHDRCPQMVLGEVYLIAIPEYDDRSFDNKNCTFKTINPSIVEKYIKSFHAITGRQDISRNFFQYEATCLLIVNFSRTTPKIYHTTEELIKDGLLPQNTSVKYEGLDWENFSAKILRIYNERFGSVIQR